MKHIIYDIFFLVALIAAQPLILSKDDVVFTFDISKSEQQDSFLEADYYPETDSSYDAVCDRSPVIKTPFYTRMITHLYIFLQSNSLRIKQFAVQQYHVLKYRTDLFFKTLLNPLKHLRSKTL